MQLSFLWIIVFYLNLSAEVPTSHSINALKGVSMGQIQQFSSRTLHKIEVKNKDGVAIGRIEISGRYHNYEDGLRNPIEPAGPANRKIVSSLQFVSVLNRIGPSESNEPNPSSKEIEHFKNLIQVLMKEKGFKDSNGQIYMVDDERFRDLFTAYLKSQWGWIAEYQQGY